MKITFERTGGFGGIRLVAVIDDVEKLPPAEAAKIKKLLKAIKPDGIYQSPPDNLRDGFKYTIKAITGAGEDRIFVLYDTKVPKECEPLIEYLTEKAQPANPPATPNRGA